MAARFFGSGAEDAVAPTDSQLRDDVASRSQFAPSSSSPRPCAPSAAAAAWREATDRREKEDKRSGLLLFFSSSVGGSFEGKKYRVRHSLSLSLFSTTTPALLRRDSSRVIRLCARSHPFRLSAAESSNFAAEPGSSAAVAQSFAPSCVQFFAFSSTTDED